MKVPSTYHTYPGHLAACLWEAKFPIARCPASYSGITWLNVGGLQGLATVKSFWMSRNWFKTKCVIQLRCFRQNPRLHDTVFISALALTTQGAPFALRRLLNYTMTMHTAWNAGAQSRLLCATNCSVPTVHIGLICSTKQNGLIMDSEGFLVFSYHHLSAWKYQINLSLDWIVLECLILKIAIWVSDLRFKSVC